MDELEQVYDYQRDGRYFAQVADGMEELAGEELRDLGANRIDPIGRGVWFVADQEALYRITYCARLPGKILAPLRTFACSDPDELYEQAGRIEWIDFLSLERTFAVAANVWDSAITHSKYAALRLKDAVVDRFRREYDERPSIDTDDPDVWLNLYIYRNQATVSLEVSGGSLHKRGYRKATVAAPMQENLAAAIIRLSGWEGQRKLIDLFCGSGTLLCEALMHYRRMPASALRDRFGFQRLPDYDAKLWRKVKVQCEGEIRPLPAGLIAGSDIDAKAVSISRDNLANLPDGDKVALQTIDFRRIERLENAVIVCNPPYGLRSHDRTANAPQLYRELGDFLKQRCAGCEAYVYTGNRALIKHIGLRTSFKIPLRNGGLDGRLLKIEVY